MLICNEKLFPSLTDEKEYYCKAKGIEGHRTKLAICYVTEKMKKVPKWRPVMDQSAVEKAKQANDCTEQIINSM